MAALKKADLFERAGLFASSRDFMRQYWIFWKACGSLLLKNVDLLSKFIENIQGLLAIIVDVVTPYHVL